MTLFDQRRDFWQVRTALRARGGEDAQAASGHVLTQEPFRKDECGDLTTEEIHDRRRSTRIDDVLPWHIELFEEHDFKKMRQSSRARRPHIGEPRVLMHPLRKLMNIANLSWYRGSDCQSQRHVARQ